MASQIKLRRDTAANWTTANPTLAQGEPAFETDTKKLKIGDGVTAWSSLSYELDPSAVVSPTGTQTLTNKTLTAPAINNGTITDAAVVAPLEAVTISATAASGTINYDCSTAAVVYYTTAATANFALNFRGNGTTALNTALAIGQSATVVFMNTNGATPFYGSAFQIDGTAVTPKWIGGTAPSSGSASAIDIYTFSIIKTAANTYTVIASVAKAA